MKKKTFKVLILSIFTLTMSLSFFSKSVFADNSTESDYTYFPTVNSASEDIPLHMNVYNTKAATANVPATGFFTNKSDSGKMSVVSIVLPVVICIAASIFAYIVLRQVKLFKRKNSESLELSKSNSFKLFTLTKNPALLLAICFGFACALPTFFLQSGVSRADSEEISDLDYDSTDFNTYVENKTNPYEIGISYTLNGIKQNSKTDAEEVAEDSTAETSENSKSEHKIEDDGEFVVGSIDVTFNSYNPTGYSAVYGLSSGVFCGTNYTDDELKECVEHTNLKSGDNIIPSISKKMTKAEFEALDDAAWGWSPDGETYYPLYSANEDTHNVAEGSYNANGDKQTIYIAAKLMSDTPTGDYQGEDFRISAVNNKLSDDLFGKYQITYKNGDKIVATTDNPLLFLNNHRGKLTISDDIDLDTDGDCKSLLGWSEETQAVYDQASDKTTIPLYESGDKTTPNSTETTLNAIWKEDMTNCREYVIQYSYGFEFPTVTYDADGKLVYGDVVTYEPDQIIEDYDNFEISSLYGNLDKLWNKTTIKTTKETITYNNLFNSDNLPTLKGYEFVGWGVTVLDPGKNIISSTTYSYDAEKKEFINTNYGASSDPVSKITINSVNSDADIPTTYVAISAKWTMNQPEFSITYIGNDGTQYAYSSDNLTTDSSWGWEENTQYNHPTIFELPSELPSNTPGYKWKVTETRWGLTIDDFEKYFDSDNNVVVYTYEIVEEEEMKVES